MSEKFPTVYTREDLKTAASALLEPDERIAASVYCTFKKRGGIFAGPGGFTGGYALVTGSGRLICIKYYISGTEEEVYKLESLTRVRVSSAGFGQKLIRLEFGGDKRHPVIMQIAGKVLGSGFPDQSLNRDRLIEELTKNANSF